MFFIQLYTKKSYWNAPKLFKFIKQKISKVYNINSFQIVKQKIESKSLCYYKLWKIIPDKINNTNFNNNLNIEDFLPIFINTISRLNKNNNKVDKKFCVYITIKKSKFV